MEILENENKKKSQDPTSDVEIKEFYLKQNSFNPTKSSPPNLFINKLELRMKNYFSIFKNSTNFSTK